MLAGVQGRERGAGFEAPVQERVLSQGGDRGAAWGLRGSELSGVCRQERGPDETLALNAAASSPSPISPPPSEE